MPKSSQKSVVAFTSISSMPVGKAQNLTSNEIEEFRAAVSNASFQKALRNALLRKPSVFSGAKVSDQFSTLSNNNVLQILRGWEMFEAALFSQLNGNLEPLNKRSGSIEETFPDAGVFGGNFSTEPKK